MSEDIYKNFLIDTIQEILEKKRSCNSHQLQDFDKGYNFALYEIISLLIEQSNNFGIDMAEIGLNDIDPERDYLFD